MEKASNQVNRRRFLKLSGLTGASLTIGFYFPALAKQSGTILTASEALEEGIELTSWVSIDKKGLVTILSHRAEMGQGAFQAIPQMIAEELEVDLNKVKIAFAPGDPAKYGNQVTGGSSSVRSTYKMLLKTGATAREMLISAAAAKWQANKADCYAADGFVLHRPTGKRLSYGELVEDASKLAPPAAAPLKARKDYKLIGKPLPRQDNPAKVNGKAEFGIDKRVSGLLFASVERSPRLHGKVKRFDDRAARAVKGVKAIVKVEMPVFGFTREGVAVVAENTWAAMQARKLLQIEWDDSGFEHVDTALLYKRMNEDLKKPGNAHRALGNAAAMLATAEKKVEAVYETPYQSHSAMEPLNCTAYVQDDKVEVWGPIQAPDWIQSDLANRLKMPPEKIKVNMTFLGGGFGRKAFTDYTYEAVAISKAVKAPVQVVWTREDDMTQGPFRPGIVYGCRASLDTNGRINAFDIKLAGQNMAFQDAAKPNKTDYNRSTTEGLVEHYLDTIPHYHFADIPTESPIPVMWWRSVYAATNVFAFESFMDELAVSAGKDPIQFRLEHLPYDNERTKALLNTLKEKVNWDQRGAKQGWGMAVTECFGSLVAQAIKVARKAEGGARIERVVSVVDCGWYVNPDIIKAQIEGAVVMGIGAAVIHQTTFKDGRAVESNFHQYTMPRMMDTPVFETYIVENDEKAGGVGEPGLPGVAPALCNAIFDLTGKRMRKLPFNLDEV